MHGVGKPDGLGRDPVGDPLAPLVAKIAAGEEDALGSLYDAMGARVFGLARRILGDPSLAEEATMDVFTQVWMQAKKFDPTRGRVESWVLTLARTRGIDALRARGRHLERTDGLDSAPEPRDEEPGPEEAHRSSERSRQIRKALWRLPAEQRQALEVAFFEGLSYSEVASALGLPLGTVKTRIRAGLAALRRTLGPAQGDLA
jgi:RNA polymerase sigma-70 factor (ECF subfamily)